MSVLIEAFQEEEVLCQGSGIRKETDDTTQSSDFKFDCEDEFDSMDQMEWCKAYRNFDGCAICPKCGV